MMMKKLEIVKQQALALDIKITVINYDVNRYSVTIGTHLFTKFESALSALTTQYLKNNK